MRHDFNSTFFTGLLTSMWPTFVNNHSLKGYSFGLGLQSSLTEVKIKVGVSGLEFSLHHSAYLLSQIKSLPWVSPYLTKRNSGMINHPFMLLYHYQCNNTKILKLPVHPSYIFYFSCYIPSWLGHMWAKP